MLGTAPAGDMFQKKTDEILKVLPNVFGFADICILDFDGNGADHKRIVCRVLQVCRKYKAQQR